MLKISESVPNFVAIVCRGPDSCPKAYNNNRPTCLSGNAKIMSRLSKSCYYRFACSKFEMQDQITTHIYVFLVGLQKINQCGANVTLWR